MNFWVQTGLAAALNVATVYCMRMSGGMRHLWYTLGVVLTIVTVQFLVADLANREEDRFALSIIVVIVSVGVGVVAIDAIRGKPPSALQAFGYAIALIGVVMATLAPKAT
jgi:hypothetical protein